MTINMVYIFCLGLNDSYVAIIITIEFYSVYQWRD